MTLSPGAKLGPYEVTGPLGSGGMGEVFRARDTRLNREVAIKVLPQADSEFDRCIRRRGEALSLFLNEEPTYGLFPPVYYYQGRAREGLKTEQFAASYRTYLGIRGQSSEDPLIPEIRRRAGQ